MLNVRSNWLSRIVPTLRELGPYAAVGLVVPGGSLLLLWVWAFRNRQWLALRFRHKNRVSRPS